MRPRQTPREWSADDGARAHEQPRARDDSEPSVYSLRSRHIAREVGPRSSVSPVSGMDVDGRFRRASTSTGTTALLQVSVYADSDG